MLVTAACQKGPSSSDNRGFSFYNHAMLSIRASSSDPAPIPLALVTGAAHRLGKAFALALAKQGFGIVLHYHRSQELIQAREGPR